MSLSLSSTFCLKASVPSLLIVLLLSLHNLWLHLSLVFTGVDDYSVYSDYSCQQRGFKVTAVSESRLTRHKPADVKSM